MPRRKPKRRSNGRESKEFAAGEFTAGAMSTSLKEMMAAANAVIDTVPVHHAMTLVDDPGVAFIDIRNAAERRATGEIPSALHASRGHLEFYVDPDSAVHKPVFGSGKRLILYCATGGRSTLAAKTLYDMGVPNVSHLAGGFAAWKEAGGPIDVVD